MREMKDSGIEWAGQIPAEWKVEKNKRLFFEVNNKCLATDSYTLLSVSEYYGVAPRAEKIKDGDFETRAESLDGYKICHKNDIVMNIMLAWKRATARTSYDGIVSPAYCVYRGKDIETRYYHYVFRTEGCADYFKRHSTGIIDSRLRLYPESFFNLNSPVPPIIEQKQIADFLDNRCSEIDAISADIQKEIETLEQYKRSIITEAVTKGLNQDAEMKDSGVAWCPQIPSNWQYTNPKGLFGLRTDRAFRNDRQLTASQEYGIVYQDEYMEKTGNKVVTVTKDFSILKHVEPDDFVISMRSFQGGLEYSDKRGCISSAYVMLIPNKEFVYAPFYRWFFKSSKYINALQSTSNLVRDGQAMRYANFVKVPLFIVPIEEQKAIASYLDEKIEKVNSILAEKKKQLEILSNYKKSLIYEYVTGKKEVLT